jgi:hypothetical protein
MPETLHQPMTQPVTPTSSVLPPSTVAGSRDRMRGLSYAEGTAALSTGPAPPPPPARNLLTRSQAEEAVAYNRRQSYPIVTIRAWQNIVKTADDGVIGPNTVQAIARWQKEHGLDWDGKIGPRTRAALEAERNVDHTPDDDHDGGPSEGGVTSGALTAHFSLSEFASRDGAATPASAVSRLRGLAEQLEVLRAELGGNAVRVISGYRSPAHNRAVGGARNSQHLYGRAADISIGGYTPRQIKNKIEQLIRAGRMLQGGIGLYGGFVHYDTRGSAARW